MSAKKGSAVPIWFSEEERRRLEEGAAVAGYKHLSTYIKDKVFGRGDFRNQSSSEGPLDEAQDEIAIRLDLILADQALQKAMLSAIAHSITKELSSSSRLELIRKLQSLGSEDDLFDSLGEVGLAIENFSKALQ